MAIVFSKEFSTGIFEVHNSKPLDLICYKTKQVHSDIILDLKEISLTTAQETTADGILDLDQNKNLCVLTADCLPILFLGKKGNALVHAGWAGVKKEIYLKPELLKIEPEHIFIGPHIQKESFEVSQDFKQHFPNSSDFFIQDNKLFFNLLGIVKTKLTKTFPQAKISHSLIDTKTDPRFHSYRRNQTILRNWNIFKIKKEF